jgi:hypothetical protein
LIINNTIPAGAVNKLSLANSVTQFSDVQGQDNWFYGKYDQKAAITANGGNVNTPYDPELFEPFSHTPGDNTVSPTNQWDGTKWDEAVNVAPWTELSAGGGHPAANGQGDPNVEWAVRRWVAPDDVDGEVEVKGNFTHQNLAAADGDVGRIFLNGTEVFHQVTANAAAPFDLILDIHPGDVLDFAADPDGAGNLLTGGLIAISDGSDGFNFSAQITLDVPFSPIPEPSSIILAGLGLVGLLGWTWRRKR